MSAGITKNRIFDPKSSLFFLLRLQEVNTFLWAPADLRPLCLVDVRSDCHNIQWGGSHRLPCHQNPLTGSARGRVCPCLGASSGLRKAEEWCHKKARSHRGAWLLYVSTVRPGNSRGQRATCQWLVGGAGLSSFWDKKQQGPVLSRNLARGPSILGSAWSAFQWPGPNGAVHSSESLLHRNPVQTPLYWGPDKPKLNCSPLVLSCPSGRWALEVLSRTCRAGGQGPRSFKCLGHLRSLVGRERRKGEGERPCRNSSKSPVPVFARMVHLYKCVHSNRLTLSFLM